MPRYKVEFSPEATAHAEAIENWWRANRPKNPGLFLRELRSALRQLRRSPHSGTLYEAPGVRPVRRILLARSGYHLYHWPDDEAGLVRVYAVWHSARGKGPALPR